MVWVVTGCCPVPGESASVSFFGWDLGIVRQPRIKTAITFAPVRGAFACVTIWVGSLSAFEAALAAILAVCARMQDRLHFPAGWLALHDYVDSRNRSFHIP